MTLFNKLLTAIHTVGVSVSPTFCVLILRAIFNGNVYIDHLTTPRAKAHRSVCAGVIKVGTTVFLPSHRFLLVICLSLITSCLRINSAGQSMCLITTIKLSATLFSFPSWGNRNMPIPPVSLKKFCTYKSANPNFSCFLRFPLFLCPFYFLLDERFNCEKKLLFCI